MNFIYISSQNSCIQFPNKQGIEYHSDAIVLICQYQMYNYI